MSGEKQRNAGRSGARPPPRSRPASYYARYHRHPSPAFRKTLSRPPVRLTSTPRSKELPTISWYASHSDWLAAVCRRRSSVSKPSRWWGDASFRNACRELCTCGPVGRPGGGGQWWQIYPPRWNKIGPGVLLESSRNPTNSNGDIKKWPGGLDGV